MAVTLKNRPIKQTKEETQAFNWFQVAAQQRSIIIFGGKGEERYELFSSCLSPFSCLQEVWRNLREDISYVLYPSLTNELFTKSENEPIKRFEDMPIYSEDMVLFIPVDPSQLPYGSMIVLPPSWSENELPPVLMDPLFHNESADYIWVEAFQYGKSESFNALNKIMEIFHIHKKNIHCALIESKRRFGFTDLDTTQEAIDFAKKRYYDSGFGEISIIESPLTPFSLLSLITEDSHHTERLLDEVFEEIKDNKVMVGFFEEDYNDMMAELRLSSLLEQIFDYRAVNKAKKNSVFEIWLDQMNRLVAKELHSQVHKLLIRKLDMEKVYPYGNYQKELDFHLQSEWTNFIKELSPLREQTKGITKNMEAVTYAIAIKNVKIELKQKINHYIEKHLYKVLHEHIQYVYSLWNRE